MQSSASDAAVVQNRGDSSTEVVTVIRPDRGWRDLGLRELWKSRELVYQLAKKNFLTRYKQTVMGAAWAFARPLAQMGVFSVVFGSWLGIGSEGAKYPVFVFAGLLPWTLFARTLSEVTQSVAGARALITKVYFPRLAIPVSAIGVSLADFVVALLIMMGLMLAYGHAFTWRLLALIPLTLLTLMITLGVGALFAALHVAYRDTRFLLSAVTSMWMFLTPVIYPARTIPESWQWMMTLNPMVGVVDTFRAIILTRAVSWDYLGASVTIGLVLLFFGLACFRRVERRFADIV
ncbi:MAG: ABC transporter permease [Phycisphaerae bacterium]